MPHLHHSRKIGLNVSGSDPLLKAGLMTAFVELTVNGTTIDPILNPPSLSASSSLSFNLTSTVEALEEMLARQLADQKASAASSAPSKQRAHRWGVQDNSLYWTNESVARIFCTPMLDIN